MPAIAWPTFWFRFEDADRWPWALLALAALVFLAWRTRSGTGPSNLFRWLGISVMLIALLEPVIGRPRRVSETGAVLLLLDASRSMTTHDLTRSPAQKMALARCLNRLPSDAVDPALDRVRRRVDQLSREADAVLAARGELDYAYLVGRRPTAARDKLASAVKSLHQQAAEAATVADAVSKKLKSDLQALAATPRPGRHDGWLNKLPGLIHTTQEDFNRFATEADLTTYRTRADVRAACDNLADTSRLELERLAAIECVAQIHSIIGPDVPVRLIAFGNGVRALGPQANELEKLAGSSFGDSTEFDKAVAVGSGARPESVLAGVLFSDGRPMGRHAANISAAGDHPWPTFTVQIAPTTERRQKQKMPVRSHKKGTALEELDNVSGRSDVLRRIAKTSGGDYLQLDNCRSITPRIRNVARRPQAPIEWKLSTGPVLFTFIVGCFVIDWTLRKRAGSA